MVAPLPHQLSTDRLELRSWLPGDVPTIKEVVLRSLDHIRPWMDWAVHEPLTDETRSALVTTWEQQRAAGTDVIYGIFLDGLAIGATGVHRRIGPGGMEIGYWLAPDATGQGFATETTRALTSMALRQPGVDHVEIHHDPANAASRAVPKRLGYRFVANRPSPRTAPAHTGSQDIWQVRRQQWSPVGPAEQSG